MITRERKAREAVEKELTELRLQRRIAEEVRNAVEEGIGISSSYGALLKKGSNVSNFCKRQRKNGKIISNFYGQRPKIGKTISISSTKWHRARLMRGTRL